MRFHGIQIIVINPKSILFFFLLPLIGFCQEICLFYPPDHWTQMDQRKLSENVITAFVGKEKDHFRPSINLATEEIDLSEEAYVTLIKSKLKKNTFRDFGSIQTKSGKATLLEIKNESPSLGSIKILQTILVQNKIAYVLTAAFLAKDFLKLQSQIFQSFQSMQLVENLLDPIENIHKKKQLKKMITSLQKRQKNASIHKLKNDLIPYKQTLGSYWCSLILQQALSRESSK